MKTTSLAHTYWKQHIQPGDIIIDATCGNGKDLVELATYLNGHGRVIGYDIQPIALKNTKIYLESMLTSEQRSTVSLILKSHEDFLESEASLVVYNLGFLPGGDKTKTTFLETTLNSLKKACAILRPKGMITVACYPGHEEGRKEEKGIMEFATHLPSNEWSVLYHQWVNRERAPSLFVLRRHAHRS